MSLVATSDILPAWVGKPPDGWQMKRLKWDVSLRTERPSEEESETLPYIANEDIQSWTGTLLNPEPTSSVFADGRRVFPDDVLFNKLRPYLAKVLHASFNGISSGELLCLRSSDTVVPRYLFYVVSSKAFIDAVNSETFGTKMPRADWEIVGGELLPLPSLETQKRIAAFLDEKTAQIDGLIATKQTLLERLAEKRQAIITKAVTCGVNRAAQLRNSGIDWLHEIPAHWDMSKIKFATTHIVDCLHTTPTYDGDLLYPAIRTADVDRGVLLLEQARLVSQEVYEERIQRLMPIEGDIVYSREGERFGMAALVPSNISLCLGQRMMLFRVAPSYNAAYLMWTLNSDFVFQQVMSDIGGSTSPHINIARIINFAIPRPPLPEQIDIAHYVEHERSRIEIMSAKVKVSLDTLTEYRAALITAAVTGQIEGLR